MKIATTELQFRSTAPAFGVMPAGADWSNLVVRVFGDSEHYSQTFSAIDATRTANSDTHRKESGR